MPNPAADPTNKTAASRGISPVQHREVLASLLHHTLGAERDEESEALLEGWQTNLELRLRYRNLADALTAALAKDGVTLRASDSKKVEKRLLYLKTVPPRPAYTDAELEGQAADEPAGENLPAGGGTDERGAM